MDDHAQRVPVQEQLWQTFPSTIQNPIASVPAMFFYQLCKQLDVFRPGSRGNRTCTTEDVLSSLASNT